MTENRYDEKVLTEKVFDFLYGCAMRDAIGQKAFQGKKDWVGKLSAPKPVLRAYIDKVLQNGFTSQQEHDAYFLQMANKLCNLINSSRPTEATGVFSFGNAQKLINMTAKHSYSLCYNNPGLREGFRFCHCPVDGIILETVWQRYENRFGKEEQLQKLTADFRKPWGNEGTENGIQPELTAFPQRYAAFQKAIYKLIGNGDIYPVEFDYLYWK